MCFDLRRHFQKFYLMIAFSIRMAVVKTEKHKGNLRSLPPHKEVVVGPQKLYLMTPQLHRTATKREKCCFHPSFDPSARLILLPKQLMCFMFLQSANSGILDPKPRQPCFPQESFFLTYVVKVSTGSTSSGQIQNEGLMDGHDGLECTAQHFLCTNDGKVFCHKAMVF